MPEYKTKSNLEICGVVPLLLLLMLCITLPAHAVQAKKRIFGKDNTPIPVSDVKPLDSFTNSVGMTFVKVPAGKFIMGRECKKPVETSVSKAEYDICIKEGRSDEVPAHKVTIKNDFWIGQYEVTQTEWCALMEKNMSETYSCETKLLQHPVDSVSWDDVQEFIRRLNKKEGGGNYRLPTEAEWEYACRSGGKNQKYCGGNDVDVVAWYDGNKRQYNEYSHPVGARQSNELGIYDMSGNLGEWVNDWRDLRYYEYSPDIDPQGPPTGKDRVYRGGSSYYKAENVRAVSRYGGTPDIRYYYVGFRLVSIKRGR